MDFKIREMRENDIDKGFLKTLENLTVIDLHPERGKDIFNQINGTPFYKLFVAEERSSGEIVGTTILLIEQKFIRGGSKAGHIEEVCTREGYEGHGIGSALVKRAIEEAKNQGCYRVELACSEDLVPFYESLGFKKHEIDMRIKF